MEVRSNGNTNDSSGLLVRRAGVREVNGETISREIGDFTFDIEANPTPRDLGLPSGTLSCRYSRMNLLAHDAFGTNRGTYADRKTYQINMVAVVIMFPISCIDVFVYEVLSTSVFVNLETGVEMAFQCAPPIPFSTWFVGVRSILMRCIRDASFPVVGGMLPVMVEPMLRGSWIVPSTFLVGASTPAEETTQQEQFVE